MHFPLPLLSLFFFFLLRAFARTLTRPQKTVRQRSFPLSLSLHPGTAFARTSPCPPFRLFRPSARRPPSCVAECCSDFPTSWCCVSSSPLLFLFLLNPFYRDLCRIDFFFPRTGRLLNFLVILFKIRFPSVNPSMVFFSLLEASFQFFFFPPPPPSLKNR